MFRKVKNMKHSLKLGVVLLIAVFLLSACNSTPTPGSHTSNLAESQQGNPTGAPLTDEDIPEESIPTTEGSRIGDSTAEKTKSELTVYFIDVGQAEAALVVCDGKAMLIDGGGVSSADLIYAFLKNRNITHLDYVVASHAHEDHVGGLAAALNFATAGVALCPVTEYSSQAFEDFTKYLGVQGLSITVPKHGYAFKLGSADVIVVGPVRQTDEQNNSSIVLKLTYGKTSFLFTGDAERLEEQDILEAGYNISATVLKVGHHGSDTSTTYPFLREIMPQYAVISCGTGNSYGHPHENVLSRLRDADVTVYRTDMQGTIVCRSNGNTVNVKTDRNAAVRTNPTAPLTHEASYIGNVNTKKFHRLSCSGLPLEVRCVTFDTREEAIESGYDPCGTCKP